MEEYMDMISLKEVLAIRQELFDKATELVAKKGADYNFKQQKEGDTLFNLRVPTILGITEDPIQNVLAIMANKVMRLSSLRIKEPDVSNESFEDSVIDLINYATYLVAFRREQRRKKLAKTKR